MRRPPRAAAPPPAPATAQGPTDLLSALVGAVSSQQSAAASAVPAHAGAEGERDRLRAALARVVQREAFLDMLVEELQAGGLALRKL